MRRFASGNTLPASAISARTNQRATALAWSNISSILHRQKEAFTKPNFSCPSTIHRAGTRTCFSERPNGKARQRPLSVDTGLLRAIHQSLRLCRERPNGSQKALASPKPSRTFKLCNSGWASVPASRRLHECGNFNGSRGRSPTSLGI